MYLRHHGAAPEHGPEGDALAAGHGHARALVLHLPQHHREVRVVEDHVVGREGDDLGEAGGALGDLDAHVVRVLHHLLPLEGGLKAGSPVVELAGDPAGVADGVHGEGLGPQRVLHPHLQLPLAEQAPGEEGEHGGHGRLLGVVHLGRRGGEEEEMRRRGGGEE